MRQEEIKQIDDDKGGGYKRRKEKPGTEDNSGQRDYQPAEHYEINTVNQLQNFSTSVLTYGKETRITTKVNEDISKLKKL